MGVLPLTWAEQAAINDTELLEVFAEVDVEVPDSLKLTQELVGVQEMKVIDPAPAVYIATAEGRMIKNLGDESDPWQCTVSIASGPGGSLEGTTTVPFEKGIAVFDNLHIDTAGSDYILQFTVTYPSTSTLPPVDTQAFEISGRPLGLEYPDEVNLVPEKILFTMKPTIWDEALSAAAESSVLGDKTWECTLSLLAGDNTGELSGTLTKTLSAGENVAIFDDIAIDAPGLGYRVVTECTSNEYEGGSVVKVSPEFSVHDYPETGMMKNSEIEFTFNGPYDKIMDVIGAFESSVVTCENCPTNIGGTRSAKKPKGSTMKNVDYPDF